jgi:hypothetical protein
MSSRLAWARHQDSVLRQQQQQKSVSQEVNDDLEQIADTCHHCW